MNFSYGIISAVGILVAISIGFISASPDDIPKSRMTSMEEKPVACTLEWNPMCGIDGETYGNPCALDAAGITLDYEGECVVPEPTPDPQSDLPMSLTISSPEGSGTPGCEENNECYLPYETTVAVGATVTWSNDDTAAHTVTSGNVNAGPTGVFDSGLFMSGGTFEFTFEEAGTYDYFCMVHPWMTGIVHVE